MPNQLNRNEAQTRYGVKPTEKIWYYDLSDVKVGKKTPLTLRHFEGFFELLSKRGDSKQSWTMDFSARLQQALDEAKPHRP